MAHYAKFMKDILNRKRKISKEGVVSLTVTYNVVIQKSLQEKMQDPRSFTYLAKLEILIWEKYYTILEIAST